MKDSILLGNPDEWVTRNREKNESIIENSCAKNIEECVIITKGSFKGEIRTSNRRHVLRSPEIVITCPADDFPTDEFCINCHSGPVCCFDEEETEDSSCTSESGSETLTVKNINCDESLETNKQNRVCCCDCGTTISSHSDYSYCVSEDGLCSRNVRETIPSLKRFSSVDYLNRNFSSPLESDNVFPQPIDHDQSDVVNNISGSSSEFNSDEEETIHVRIGEELKEVIDNHIKSRKKSTSSIESDYYLSDSSSDANYNSRSKETEILQKFLEQVETHPQEEDLDVILEIVGEEDEEPYSRSRVNIRECTEKFKEIYSRKLKQIYHNKCHKSYDNETSKFKNANKIKEIDVKPKENDSSSKTELFFEANNESYANEMNQFLTANENNSVTKKERTMIDKLPEIRQFHPKNIDSKLPYQDGTYLKATSLINEIESCFMETAFLVEKSIGSNKPSSYVLKSERDATNTCLCDSANEDDPSKLNQNANINSKKHEFEEESKYDCLYYNKGKSDRLMNEYQYIWNSVENDIGQKEMNSREEDNATPDSNEQYTNNAFLTTPNIDYKSQDISKEVETNNNNDDILSADHVPRSLEESIDIFEMILADRRKEHRKSYESELCSSALVLNATKYSQHNVRNDESNITKYKSSDDLLDSTASVTSSHQHWFDRRERCQNEDSNVQCSNEYTNHCSTKITDTPRYRSSSDIKLLETNHRNKIYKEKSFLSKFRGRSRNPNSSTYRRYDVFDSLTDDESYTHARTRHSCWWHDDEPEIVSKKNCLQTERKEEEDDKEIQGCIKTDENGKDIKETISCESYGNGNKYEKESQCHKAVAASANDNKIFNKWKSESDISNRMYPVFGFQSSSTEEYYEKNDVKTSMTSTVHKNVTKSAQQTMEENGNENISLEEFRENQADDNRGETIAILSHQPLFAKVDEMLRGLVECRVDSITSDSDEGVVSDQSEISDKNNNGIKTDCYSASQIFSTINGTDGDTELENNIIQIVRGINSISEKHLGEKIEEELGKIARPAMENLCDGFNLNIKKSINAFEKQCSHLNFSKYSNKTCSLSTEIKNVSKSPELEKYINYSNQKQNQRITTCKEASAMEEISRISDELKTLGIYDGGTVPDVKVGTEYTELPIWLQRSSRRADYYRNQDHSSTSPAQEQVTRQKRSSSCGSYFNDVDSGAASDDSNPPFEKAKNLPESDNVLPEISQENVPARNSFILKMLHENLRCYVITLAFLEKMLTEDVGYAGNETDSALMITGVPDESTPLMKFETCDEVRVIPIPNPYSPPSDTESCWPASTGHAAFLRGLQRKHRLEVCKIV